MANELRMYFNGYDTVIAHSVADASAAWGEGAGERPEDIEGKTNGTETHPPAWRIERFGRGFLCSTET